MHSRGRWRQHFQGGITKGQKEEETKKNRETSGNGKLNQFNYFKYDTFHSLSECPDFNKLCNNCGCNKSKIFRITED